MKDANEKYIKEIVDTETLDGYQAILNNNTDSYALYIAGSMICTLKKTRKIILKDKLKIIANHIVYEYNCLLTPERKDSEFEKSFDTIFNFLKEFKITLKEFKKLIYEETNDVSEIADLYLYFLTLLSIHNNIFNIFDSELTSEALRAKEIYSDMHYDKTIDENIEDFNKVREMMLELKKED